MASHRGSLLSEPLWISLVLTVQIHFLGPQRHAAVAVEVETVVSTDIGPLLLQLSVLSLQELRQTRFGPLGPGGRGRENKSCIYNLKFYLSELVNSSLKLIQLITNSSLNLTE